METIKKILSWTNENHWYIIAAIILCAILIWIYGCQSTVTSMMDPDKKINRDELKLETDYLIGQMQVKLADLDRQDEIKRLLLEQASIIATTGTFNPIGLINMALTIGAIAFGLNRNQKLNAFALSKTQPQVTT